MACLNGQASTERRVTTPLESQDVERVKNAVSEIVEIE